ncbi:MAG: hypothetical protein Kow00121_07300 [Elainellaceae cyanobacterium]
MYLLLLIGLLIRLVIALYLHPGFDEAYYYLYTLHPSLSYFDHPPLVALTTGFGVWLTGTVSQFTIRIGSLFLYTGASVFLYLTGLRLFSRPVATLTLAIATIVPIFQVGFGVLTLPDSALMLFWSASLYVCACEFFARPFLPNVWLEQYRAQDLSFTKDEILYQPTYRLAVIGLLVGLACLGKYHGFVLGLSLVGFCLFNRSYRAALTSPWMATGVGLFLAALAPVLVWNAQHDWVSFVYQSSRAVPSQGYQWGQAIATALLTIAYLFPTIGLPMWGAIGHSTGTLIAEAVTGKAEQPLANTLFRAKLSFLLWVSLPLILGFTYIGGYQAILPTWQMPGFWGATILLAYYAASWRQSMPRLVRRWLLGSAVAIVLLLAVALLHVSFGILQKPGGWLGGVIPVETDGSTQTIDIQQLRQGFQQPQLRQALQTSNFVFTNQIFIAGQVAMAIAPFSPLPITCFSDDLRGFAFWSAATDWVGKDALYVTSARFEQEISADFADYFQSIESIAELPIRRAGVTVETFKVFRATELLKPYPRPYG